MPQPRRRIRQGSIEREEMSTHLFIKMEEEVRKLIDAGMERTEAEKRVFGEFFRKKRQK